MNGEEYYLGADLLPSGEQIYRLVEDRPTWNLDDRRDSYAERQSLDSRVISTVEDIEHALTEITGTSHELERIESGNTRGDTDWASYTLKFGYPDERPYAWEMEILAKKGDADLHEWRVNDKMTEEQLTSMANAQVSLEGTGIGSAYLENESRLPPATEFSRPIQYSLDKVETDSRTILTWHYQLNDPMVQ